ncbi:hypothetical protein ACH8ZP_03000 [Chlamydia pneumoniae]|uniref:Uncharacterized protein n=1 Tax=Chlamydia pneumoniae TaxID=83558 RepID=Q9K2D5_CHLPN|nr:hypothetical protein [Chlamydia pneumoniae]AAF38029.1 hypothetical protein CP_0147 [Chlamydia pneumoniae AR39]CRI33116.1 Uncharacterized protein BN1224_Wien1_A_06230 [Chlamydia pneumoniae]CRI35979.1 Uncharacterized protein BN1224_CM1_A_06260 [Chlamydia pneumoniae]CRI37106.1 Uncharacterized protein BN1224_CV14_A_06250 [Chlamydia pneumoniae]CRI38234.1 Uncharacterized protein BN1224_CV15_C_00670 [Chlamydia pneumoniae]
MKKLMLALLLALVLPVAGSAFGYESCSAPQDEAQGSEDEGRDESSDSDTQTEKDEEGGSEENTAE